MKPFKQFMSEMKPTLNAVKSHLKGVQVEVERERFDHLHRNGSEIKKAAEGVSDPVAHDAIKAHGQRMIVHANLEGGRNRPDAIKKFQAAAATLSPSQKEFVKNRLHPSLHAMHGWG